MDVNIKKQWNGEEINHLPVNLKLNPEENGLKICISAPYFNDPAPDGERGKPLWLLWDYEVVEAFFLNSTTGEYLELEFGPHGQHLALIFKECRKPWKKCLDLVYDCEISQNKWTGTAIIPWDYFPTNTNKFNAYAIHGTDKERVYEALFPVPKSLFLEPDFHRLEYFQNMPDLISMNNKNKSQDSIWNYPV